MEFEYNSSWENNKNLFQNIKKGLGGLWSGVESLWNRITGRGQTNAERAAQDFSAEQAQINRDFQSAEAQKARQWQEDFYTQYQSPQAQVRQYQEAGLNPALMYGRGATTAASASTASNGPSGDTAAGVVTPADPSSLLNMILGMAKLPSEIDLINAQADDFRASATGKDIQNAYSPQILEQNLQRGEMDILNTEAAITTAQYQWALMSSQEQLNLMKTSLTESEISDVLASASLKEKQAATEVLKQANLEVTNDLLAAQIATEKMKPLMVEAQSVLARNQGVSISLDNFQKELTNGLSRGSGIPAPKNAADLLFKVTGEFGRRVDKGITSAKNWITKTGKRLLKL